MDRNAAPYYVEPSPTASLAATRELISAPVINSGYTYHTERVLKPQWLNLFALIFHCYFLSYYLRYMLLTFRDRNFLVQSLLVVSGGQNKLCALQGENKGAEER